MSEAAELATGAVNAALSTINTSEHPRYVTELVGAYRANITEALASAEQLEADRAEIASKAIFLPPAGSEHLERQAQAEAETRGKAAMERARTAVDALRRAALLDSQPKVDPSRESLGRDEMALIIGEGSDAQLLTRVHHIAERAGRDAVAALGTDFARALLETRGLSGRDLDDALSSARRVVAERAASGDSRFNDSERRAARLYLSIGELEAGLGATSFALSHSGISHA